MSELKCCTKAVIRMNSKRLEAIEKNKRLKANIQVANMVIFILTIIVVSFLSGLLYIEK